MHYPEVINSALDFIEQNLKTTITAEELAQMANYSTYHYYRLFSSVVGSSIANYILKRRLDHALAEIADGRKAIEVVLEYGFDTYAGFYKAFVKMYGCSPRKYLSIYNEHIPKRPEVANMYTERELRNILDNWDIEKGLPIHDIYINGGSKVSRNVWMVGSDYILKSDSREKIVKNLKISRALHNQGFDSSLPVLTKTGSEYLEGKELFVLTHGLKGNPLPKSDRFGENRVKFGEQYGRSIAKLHKALKAVQSDILPDEVDLHKNIADWALPSLRRQNIQWSMGLAESFFSNFIKEFGELYDILPKQLIHRDPNPSNILFDDGKVSGFIDFDLSEINIRLWDVCYCATGILSECSDKSAESYEKWLDLLGGILNGYDLEGKLTSEEKQAVYYVICSIQMICIAYFESHDAYKELAKTNRQMLQFIVHNEEKIKNLL
ncbi:MAG: phosphotransferase [Clostridiales bacterium]|jgi:AraC-like DNA-binding protein/Ser/Thr protein kinase RdoA (MazF antagonist)|nr:phosphotransferase [Clostridiales bacterium]